MSDDFVFYASQLFIYYLKIDCVLRFSEHPEI